LRGSGMWGEKQKTGGQLKESLLRKQRNRSSKGYGGSGTRWRTRMKSLEKQSKGRKKLPGLKK